jgi:hypothetical protein
LIGLLDARAGIAFGVALALVALGKWNAARVRHAAAPADLRLGVLNVAVAVVFAVVLAVRPGGASDSAWWAGQWATDWGAMTISPSGGGFAVTYTSAGASGTATLSRLGDGQLEGKWCRNACEPPNDSGRLRLQLSSDGESLEGWYSNGDGPIVTSDPNFALRGRRAVR